LKPGNIFVTEKGAVKVLDFGLAKQTPQTGASDESPTETLAGTISGTAAYMSPEQAEGKPVDARTDIFSFGAVLYEMATGRRAFGGENAMKTLAAVIKDEPPAMEGLPRDLERIIRRCLRKNADERYQHMGDVRIALAGVYKLSAPMRTTA
jgi:serine/threonine protein kinase